MVSIVVGETFHKSFSSNDHSWWLKTKKLLNLEAIQNEIGDFTDFLIWSHCSILIRYIISGEKLVELDLGVYDVSTSQIAEIFLHCVKIPIDFSCCGPIW